MSAPVRLASPGCGFLTIVHRRRLRAQRSFMVPAMCLGRVMDDHRLMDGAASL